MHKYPNEAFTFRNEEFGDLQVVFSDTTPYFPAEACLDKLGFENHSKALEKYCLNYRNINATVVYGTKADGTEDIEVLTKHVIPEQDLYRLVAHSPLPEPKAAKFEKWVSEEIMDHVREHYSYAVPEITEKLLLDTDFLIKTLEALKTERFARQQLEKQIESDKPKVAFYDSVIDDDKCITMLRAAKVLNIESVGRTKLFRFLRENNILMNDNLPYQQYIDEDYFRVVEKKICRKGEQKLCKQTLVSQRGLDFINRLFRSRAISCQVKDVGSVNFAEQTIRKDGLA